MRHMRIWRLVIVLAPTVIAAAFGGIAGANPGHAPANRVAADARAFFAGADMGSDVPSVLYYSANPVSGHRDSWGITLPKQPPSAVVRGRSWSFQVMSAFWFGMAVCDTQSYPQQTSVCTPDSNANIKPPAQHPGGAYLQVQFYPPGWAGLPDGVSCDPTRWCAAMVIQSLSEDPVNGTELNLTCQGQVGLAYENFAFLTRTGVPIGPPNPVNLTVTSFTPDPKKLLFMKPGDKVALTMHDSANGVAAVVHDLTTKQNGSMTASAANGFGQVQAAPTGTSCTNLPYSFHAMYATSSPRTEVPWAAHSYNIAAGVDIGGFDSCSAVLSGNCIASEGVPGDLEPSDIDEASCLAASQSSLVRVNGCVGVNSGFDGPSYVRDWPNGNTSLRPTPVLFTSPLTGPAYQANYAKVAFETNTPFRERSTCHRDSGLGCTLLPVTDDSAPVTFYPFFSITRASRASACHWFLGDYVPGLTASDFGGVFQYGSLRQRTYLTFGGGGSTTSLFTVYRQPLAGNPCPA